MKKLFAILLAALLAMFMLAACTPAATSSTATSSANSGNTAEAQVLKVAALDAAYGVEMWKNVAKAFEVANPGVTVELITDKKLEDVVGPNMKAGDYPDVVHLATGREAGLTETFIKENAIEDITDVLSMTVPGETVTVKEKILGGFLDTTLTNPYDNGKTYLAPMFFSPCGLFFNQALLAEKGWAVPTTWDEMWELGDKAKAEGIALFAYPTAGYFDAFFFSLMYEAGGPEFFEKATHYTEGIWDTPEAQAVFDVVAKLATYIDKTVPANANSENYLKNQQLILDNKAIFMPNGTWVTGEMAEAPFADGFEWGFMALPALKTGGDRYSFTWFEQAWIPSGAANKDLAKQFIAFLYSDTAAQLFAASDAMQPITTIGGMLSGEKKLLYSIYDNGAKAALGGFAATEPIEGLTVYDTFFAPVDSLVSGAKTEQEWVDGIKSANNKFRAALIK